MEEIHLMDHEIPAFHGYARESGGDRRHFVPPVTLAISRQAGARGAAIARRSAEILGWQYLDQETLEYMTQDSSCYSPTEEPIGKAAEAWIEEQATLLSQRPTLAASPELARLARVLLEIAARGSTVMLGRGAGCILPEECRLHVRLVAPEKDRVAYVAQVSRLSLPDAARVMRERDAARSHFIQEKFGVSVDDPFQYALLINTSQFGTEGSAALIAAAVRERERLLESREGTVAPVPGQL